jgi:protein-S-isoprenylcysteine O-methyltransferase Ste14
MTNRTKWLIAVPFTLTMSEVLPALIAGDVAWFLDGWPELIFFLLTTTMWLAATAFVDLRKTRVAPDRPRRLISLGLMLVIPLSVYDRAHLMAPGRAQAWSPLGLGLCALGIAVGVSARSHLGRFYSPQPETSESQELIRTGPYRVIRHPMYAAALLWGAGWPLILASLWGLVAAWIFLIPAVLRRIKDEEALLLERFGPAYADYQSRSWRLIPFLY